jgi:hypothetical protein
MFNLFAQIRKVDEAKRLVFGRAAQEVADKSGEIMDYASSKPHFAKWSEDISKDTDGKSLGNVRAMHGKVAAGKLTEISFNDDDMAVDVCAKIVDDQEWKKVLEGVYTGFSIGGAYVGDKKVEKINGQDITRYTAKPSELSLVDRPCIPSARFFEVQKADGTLEKVDFAAAEEEIEGVVEGTAEQVDQLTKLMADNGLDMGKVLEVVEASLTKGFPPAEEAASEEEEDGTDEAKAKKAKRAAEEAEKLDATWGESLTKLEAAIAEVLTKADASISDEDKARVAAVQTAIASLTPVEKSEAATLQKLDDSVLQKMVADAVAPLQKALDDAAAKITKLEAQPAPSKIKLRAISKGEDFELDLKKEEPTPIQDGHGEQHEAAGLIKMAHKQGGSPLLVLNK